MKLYKERDRYGILAVGLGILGMVLWAIPMASIFVNLICIYCAFIGLDTRYRDISIAALLLGFIGVILSLFRSALVFFLIS